MISRATIDRIYQAAIIEDVIGEFVHLKKSGSSYKGLSPFSNEKTPSFFVVPAKGIYKDFSSGKGGNVIDFLMQHERMTYPEALRWLANRYQIEIEEDKGTAEQQEERSEREQLSVVTEFAHRFFREQLMDTEEGRAIGLSYFEERGMRPDIIEKFQLGYDPDRWDAMTKAALEAGYSLDYLIKAGLTRQRDGAPYDFFRGRVIFPIHNISGKVIAFAGRTLKAEKDIAKYFNSPESELYVKSNVLFGMHLAKNAIVKSDTCYLVEGYTDVIALHQAGIENVVASSGTSLTEGQIKLIRRYTPNITILYDGDAAGIKASFRGIDMILKEGLNVRIVLFPDGDDPDSFAKKHSSEEIRDFIADRAQDFIRFKTSLLLKEAGSDPVKRAGLIRGIVESIALIPDGIQRSVYVQECSHLLGMQENVLINELNKVIRAQFKKEAKEELPVLDEVPADGIPPEEVAPEFTLYHQEKDLVRLLLTYGDQVIHVPVVDENGQSALEEARVAEVLAGGLEHDGIELETPVYRNIFSEYLQLVDKPAAEAPRHFAMHPDPEVSSHTTDLLTSPYALSTNWTLKHQIYPETEEMNLRTAIMRCLMHLKLRQVMRMIENAQKALATASTDDEVDELLSEQKSLETVRKVLADHLGVVILR